MTEHYTKSTVSTTVWCRKHGKFTLHRVDDGRVGPCMACIAETAGDLRFEAVPEPAAPQPGLFDGPAAKPEAKAAIPGVAAEVAAMAPPMGHPDGAAISNVFAEACEEGRFVYRGYGMEDGDRVYAYSRVGEPEIVFRICLARWDRTAEMLEREARKTERWLA